MTSQLTALLESPAFQKTLLRLPTITSVLLLIACALISAKIIWLLVAPENTTAPITQPSPESQKGPAVLTPDFARHIEQLHLFGVASASKESDTPVDAPETQLNLKLRGLYAVDEDEKAGLALIASGSAAEKLYAVGDKIPGNTRLKAVYPTHVVLERNGKFETLRLVDTKKTGGKSAGTPGRQSGQPRTTQKHFAANSRVAKLRTEILKNPAKLAELVSAQPAYENGAFAGYRISTRKRDPVFKDLNIKSGDIITEVNGIAIDTPQKGIQILQQLRNATQVDVTIKRKGQLIQLSHSL